MRVVVRIRPLIQGESTLMNARRMNVSCISGKMQVDCENNKISLAYDARNKDPKSFRFDKVCDGQVSQREFYR